MNVQKIAVTNQIASVTSFEIQGDDGTVYGSPSGTFADGQQRTIDAAGTGTPIHPRVAAVAGKVEVGSDVYFAENADVALIT